MTHEAVEKLKNLNSKGKLPFHFDDKKLKIIREGGQTIPLKAGEKIIRISKNRGLQSWEDMKRESEISNILREQNLTTLTSDVKIFSSEDISFAYHEIVPGDILEGKKGEEIYSSLTEKQKNFFAKDLAIFFAELHEIPLDTLRNLSPYAGKKITYDYERSSDFDYNANKKTLDKFGIDLDNFRTSVTEDKVFCHNDLHGGNLAVDPSREHILNGVFDFGNADINNRSADFIKLCAMDRNLARKTVNEYNKLTNANVSMKEIDYQYLNWMAESIKEFEKISLNGEQKAAVEHKFKRDLGMFRSDVLKEKISHENKEVPSLFSQKERATEINPALLAFQKKKKSH